MGIASLVLGIISLIIGFIPLCGSIALIPAIIGLILGIIDIASKNKKQENKGQSITGIVLSTITIFCIVFWLGIGFNEDYSNEIASTSIKSESKSKIYEVGEIVNIGNWQLKVLGSENKKILKTNYKSKTTENNYIIVKLQIKNLSNEPTSLLTTASELTSNSYQIYSRSMLELYDGKSKYVADYTLDSYVDNDFDIMLGKINPNTAIIYNVVFETDLPTTQKEYKLKVNNNDKIFLKIN